MASLIPSNFFPQIYNDFKTLNEYRKARSEGKSFGHEGFTDLQKKSYAAAYRIFGAVSIGIGCFLAANTILPIMTFKFCLGVAASVALAVIGRDIFTISRKREEMKKEAEISKKVEFKSFLKGPAVIYEDTLVPAAWKFMEIKA